MNSGRNETVRANRLGLEQSPYLLQHKNNPVWWQPWGEAAFELAKRENKPIFLSVGYSTCYWCHMMEHDSFESEEVAEALNKNFIAIKVDREERPDVDQIYMDAVVALTGHGGWPMSVFLTPDRKPFWGGTYFPREQFLKILGALSTVWQSDREKVMGASEQVLAAIQDRAELRLEEEPEKALSSQKEGKKSEKEAALLLGALHYASSHFDEAEGGFSEAPKFPPGTLLALLIRMSQRLKDPEERARAREMASKTLERMARGGIFDQLGGGFHRYSTDASWTVPHFEKMLYDNAILAGTYLEASQILGREDFALIARDTLVYMQRDLGDSKGGFFAAEDAGEVGQEGEFYVWKESELRAHLDSAEFQALKSVHPISSKGNFEHASNILLWNEAHPLTLKNERGYQKLRLKLLDARDKRARPLRDEKVLTAWNGLAISAFAKGFQVLREETFLAAAQQAAERLLRESRPQRLVRSLCGGTARHEACLDDYAYFIEGLLELYRADLDGRWLDAAAQLQREQDDRLWDGDSGGYFYSAATDVIVRKKDYLDNATPSASAASVGNLLMLARLLPDPSLEERASKLIHSMSAIARRYPSAAAKLLMQIDILQRGVREVSVLGPSPKDTAFTKWVHENAVPHVLLKAGGALPKNHEQVPLLQVCERQVCRAPEPDSATLRKSLQAVMFLG